jgi:hypothetical protein
LTGAAKRRTRTPGRGVVALCFVVALSGIGAARAPGPEPATLCVPYLTNCSAPAPSPAPAPGPIPGATLPGGLDSIPGGTSTSGPQAPPVAAVPDANAPTFTLPAAQLGGSSISFSGLHSVSVVTVPLADGTRTPVIKLMADGVVINDFVLDVRKATGPSLVSTSGRMELRGNVQVYLDSATATLLDGTAITLGASTPPPGNELPSTLLKVHLGLVGVTADSITLIPSHQSLK